MQHKVLVLFCGGTLGMRPTSEGLTLDERDFSPGSELNEQIISSVRLGIGSFSADVEVFYLDRDYIIDSALVGVPHWQKMLDFLDEYIDKFSVVILIHGTDTLSYTSAILSYKYSKTNKCIILTGSQTPIFQIGSDAHDNLSDAGKFAGFCMDNAGVLNGVFCAFYSSLLWGPRVRKFRSTDYNAFSTPNYPNVALIRDGEVKVEHIPIYEDIVDIEFPNVLKQTNILDFNVTPSGIIGTLEAVSSVKELDAIIIRAYGTGNMSYSSTDVQKIRDISEASVKICMVSGSPYGSTNIGLYKSSGGLLNLDVYEGYDITPDCMYIKLILANSMSSESSEAFLRNPQCEEFTLS